MRKVFITAGRGAAYVSCITLLWAAGLTAQQPATQHTWNERPPSPQTSHSRLFSHRAGRPLEPIEHVIIISVDGMMPETYLRPDAHGLKVPTLRELARAGAYSEGVLGVFPTVTYPSHTSIVTGVNPGTHGIMANGPFAPLGNLPGAVRWYTEDIRVPTLWQAARAKGLKTALVYWPVTVGARANALVPEFWRQDPGTPDDAKLNFAISTPGLLDTVARRFPDFRAKFVPPQAQDEALTDIAVHVIEYLQPHLLLLHIFDVDHWQHVDGPFTGRALPALEIADQQIARVIAAAKKAGIWDETALVIVSDHGQALTTQRVRPGVWLREKGLIALDDKNRITDWKAYVLPSSGSAYVYVKDKDDQETRQVLLDLFQQAVANSATSGIRRFFTHDQIVALGGDPQAFLALEAAEGWSITGGVRGDVIAPAVEAAEHGWPPEMPAMRPSLLIYGPSIGHGKIEGARLIDIAPTVARWLGLKLEKAEGKPLQVPLRDNHTTQTPGKPGP